MLMEFLLGITTGLVMVAWVAGFQKTLTVIRTYKDEKKGLKESVSEHLGWNVLKWLSVLVFILLTLIIILGLSTSILN